MGVGTPGDIQRVNPVFHQIATPFPNMLFGELYEALRFTQKDSELVKKSYPMAVVNTTICAGGG